MTPKREQGEVLTEGHTVPLGVKDAEVSSTSREALEVCQEGKKGQAGWGNGER